MASNKTALLFLISLVILIILPILIQASPSDYFEKLKGSRKGSRSTGVHELKKYLEHYGYLKYPSDANGQANDDYFDDLLEHALKTYQSNYLLNTTGILDDETISTLTTPRCGNPDIINGTNWMQFKNKHGNSMFHQVEHYSFFPGRPKWPRRKTHLTYGFYSKANVPAVYRTAISSAFRRWGAATRFSFSQTSYRRADLTIAFARGDHGDGDPFDGRGNRNGDILAHAFAPTDGRFHLDADDLWSIGAVPGRADVATVALHEIGHLLGLDHSRVRNAIMYPLIELGKVKGLAADDINGVRALYK